MDNLDIVNELCASDLLRGLERLQRIAEQPDGEQIEGDDNAPNDDDKPITK